MAPTEDRFILEIVHVVQSAQTEAQKSMNGCPENAQHLFTSFRRDSLHDLRNFESSRASVRQANISIIPITSSRRDTANELSASSAANWDPKIKPNGISIAKQSRHFSAKET